MAIRMKEWGMLAAPGQAVTLRTQGLHGWERVGRSVGKGVSDVLQGAGTLGEWAVKVNNAGDLADFTEELRSISAEVRDELKDQNIRDWDYSWNAVMSPRLRDALQGLSAESRESAQEMARLYSAQASIEAQRDRDMQRVASARRRWERQVEAAISSGQEEQATRWLEAGRGVFVPEGQMEERLAETRSRACQSRIEARLQSTPLEALAELAAADKNERLSLRPEERRQLEQSCDRVRRSLRRELALRFSDSLRAGEDIAPATLELASAAGVIPSSTVRGKGQGMPLEDSLSLASRTAWRRWLDARADGEENEHEARLAIATAAVPLAERRELLAYLERTAGVSAADRRAFGNQVFELYHAGALGCPGDAEAQRALLELQEEGATLLAEQGADAVAAWVEARRGGAANWVCYEEDGVAEAP